MARLERLREQVVDLGIIPRREGATGLPTEVYYLKVKELAELVADPSLAPGYVEMAKLRSKKRRRKKYIKDKAMEEQFGAGEGGHLKRLEVIISPERTATCLGWFLAPDRFMSETGFSKSKRGYVYQLSDRRILLTDDEAHRAWVSFGIPIEGAGVYKGTDLQQLIFTSEDRIYKDVKAQS